MFERLGFRIEGITQHVQHNGQLADPLNPYALKMKELTGLHHSKKTPQVHQQIQDLEWEASLYLDADKKRVIVPGLVIEGAMFEAGKAIKKGPKVREGLHSPGEWPLIHHGPKDLEKLRADPAYRWTIGVKNPSTGGRTMRTRPIFRQWSLYFEIMFRPDMLSPADIERLVSVLGTDIGLSDDRHRGGGRYRLLEVKKGLKAA